jgi:hypothetical protein
VKELARSHWVAGTLVAVGGALTYRFGPGLLDDGLRLPVQIAGLALVPLGLFWIARGVSHTARERGDRD